MAPGGRWAKTESALQDRKAQVADNMLAAFELIEQTLQIRPWVFGQDFSIADAYLHTFARLVGARSGGYAGTEQSPWPSSSNGAAPSGSSCFGRRGDAL